MTSVRSWAALASVGLAVSAATVATGTPASASLTSSRAALAGSMTPGSERAKTEGRGAAGSAVSFDINLSPSEAPTQGAVAAAETWLRQQGFSVGAVPADRLFIPASGSATQVERAFSP